MEQEINRWKKCLNKEELSLLLSYDKLNLEDAFSKKIEFGTAGMRGLLGIGPNRINRLTITLATYSFGLMLLQQNPKPQVVIAHDNRYFSAEFSRLSANVLNKLGIKSFLFNDLRPTPELSFAVRYLNCDGGIVITASHNPKEYNGFKVYDHTGCQIVPTKLESLTKTYQQLDYVEIYKKLNQMLPLEQTEILSKEIDDEYVRLVENISLNKDLDKKNFKIVFSPQHGTSYINAMRIFTDLNYDVTPVQSQVTPDPNFSGTITPNPEDPRAYLAAINLAKEIDADLILTTDPDADRVGLAYKDLDGQYKLLTGNESASLLLDYILSYHQNNQSLSPNHVMYNTVVTSRIGEEICKLYKIKHQTFLTGFKYIGEAIHKEEVKKDGLPFIFGYEESYGCLIRPFVRDKDALQAILLYAEMTLFYLRKGVLLSTALDNLYKRVGYYGNTQISLAFPGIDGSNKMNSLIERIRSEPIPSLINESLIRIDDFKSLLSHNIIHDQKTKLKYDQQNMLILNYTNDLWIAIRPSGTEPKCKIYLEIRTKSQEERDLKLNQLIKEIHRIVD